ncbi:MAG: hypothetical protein HY908_33540 [Myxococcales bacterium]|nr:hypothetical protein [Myxococcales bacterium]
MVATSTAEAGVRAGPRPRTLAALITVDQIHHWPAPYASALLSVAAARRLAERERLPYLAVMAQGECVGVVSGSALEAAGRDDLLLDCIDVMPAWIDPSATVEQALGAMRRLHLPCLLCRHDGQLGLLSLEDVGEARDAASAGDDLPFPGQLPRTS